MNKQLTIIFLFLLNTLWAQIPAGYYDNAQGLTGYQLKTALSQIITNGHTPHSYNDLYTAYQTTDIDHYYENDGTILDMYSEIPNGPDSYEYSPTSQHCGQYTHEGDCYNREHLMPQSIFNSASPMKSDAHFVVPTDGYVNNRRSAYPFGEVSNPTWTSSNGSKLGHNTTSGYNGTVFEPIDEFKGDIARMLFYVATRYENEIAGWGNTAMLNHTSDQVFSDWFLQLLLNWSNQDPVSQREIDRNNAVYNYQGNRNPFIDHPEWVNTIWNQNPDTTPPSIPANVHVTSITGTSISISWNASTDDVAVASYEIYLDNNLQGTTTTTQYNINGLTPATTYSICVKAKDTSGNLSACSTVISATTNDGPSFPVNQTETFDNCPTMAFVTVNEASNKNWHCINQHGENNSPAIQMNGYQEDVPSKDWLITISPINFDEYTNERLSMFLAYAYGTMSLEVVYSSDYDGNGSPWLFTWTPVPNVNIPTPNGSTSPTELTIDNADVSSINGSVYLAFKYYSNGSPTRWTVDSVKLTADPLSVTSFAQNHTKIYPNPVEAGQNFNISTNDINIRHLNVFDTTGKLILSINNFKKHAINTTGIKKGIYFIKINTDKGMIIKKLIVE